MLNYWYVARANELFLDIDNVSRSIKHAKSRLQGAIECGKLDVAYVMSRPSKTKNHVHTIVTLKDDMMPIEKSIWEIILHGDIYRGCCGAMRAIYFHTSPDVLISPGSFFETAWENPELPVVFRRSDDGCNCPTKHNRATMETCPAAKRLRGINRAVGFFGKPSKNPCTVWPD
jgi:hypothetical protein